MESSLSAFTSAVVIGASAHTVDLRPGKIEPRVEFIRFYWEKGARGRENLNSPQGRPRGRIEGRIENCGRRRRRTYRELSSLKEKTRPVMRIMDKNYNEINLITTASVNVSLMVASRRVPLAIIVGLFYPRARNAVACNFLLQIYRGDYTDRK